MRVPVYLDHHATTPVDPRVLKTMLPYFTEIYGNPASQDHIYGVQAVEAVEHARERVASALGARSEEIVFTSGATESDNTAVLGVALAARERGKRIVTCVTEHKAVLDPCRRLEALGFRVTYLPVARDGLIDVSRLEDELTKETILVSIMAANNEIGTIAPLREVAQVCSEKDVYLHTDAAQGFGHVPLDSAPEGLDLISLSGHKMYGPKGVGALYIRRRGGVVGLDPLISGGGQERGIRAGTLNVPGIVGLGEAARIAIQESEAQSMRTRGLAQRLLNKLETDLGQVQLNGHTTRRLPHNLSLTIDGVDAKALIRGVQGSVALSAGSACTTDSAEPSHVLLAIGLTRERAYQTIRIGMGRYTTADEVDLAAEAIVATAMRIRRLGPRPTAPTPS